MTVLCTTVKWTSKNKNKKTDSNSRNHFTAMIMMSSWGVIELTTSAIVWRNFPCFFLLPLNDFWEIHLDQTGSFRMVQKYLPNPRDPSRLEASMLRITAQTKECSRLAINWQSRSQCQCIWTLMSDFLLVKLVQADEFQRLRLSTSNRLHWNVHTRNS